MAFLLAFWARGGGGGGLSRWFVVYVDRLDVSSFLSCCFMYAVKRQGFRGACGGLYVCSSLGIIVGAFC